MEKVTERYELNKQLAQMLKGGVIMDVTTPEHAKIAEAAGACAVMALERILADIRAPYVSETSPDVEVLAVVDNKIVGVRYNSQFAYAFHPELDDNTQIHELFLRSISAKS